MRPLLPIRSFADLVTVLARHRAKMFTVLLLCIAASAAYGAFGTPIYRSEARLLLRLGRENSNLDPTTTLFRTVNVSQSRLDEINSELQILGSHDLRERVVDAVGPERLLGAGKSRDEAIQYLERNARSRLVPDSYVLILEFEHRDPEVAKLTVEAMIAAFQQKHLAAHESPGAYNFLAAQLTDIGSRVVEREESLVKLQTEMGALSVGETERGLQTRLHQVKAELAGIDSELAGRLAARDAVVNGSQVQAALAPLRSSLQELQVEELRLRGKGYLAESISVVGVRQAIGEIQEMLARATTEQQALALQVEDGLASGLEARRAISQEQVKELESQLAELGSTSLTASRLERELNTLHGNQTRYQESLEQARIEGALRRESISNVSIVQPAMAPERPVRPSLFLCLAVGLLVGLFLACGVVLFAEFSDDRVKPWDDAAVSGTGQVMLSLPRAADAAASMLARVLRTGKSSPFIGQMERRLQPMIEDLWRGVPPSLQRPKAYAVTGTNFGVGTTTTAMLLSTALARQTAGPVLLVDAEFVTAGLSAAMGHNNPGFTNSVSREPDAQPVAMTQLGPEQLHLLGIGTGSRVASAAADPTRFVAVLRALQRRYPVIVFDLSPILDHASAQAITGLCDATLLVAEAGVTKMSRLTQACGCIEATGSTVVSVVLNKVPHALLASPRLVG